MAIKRLTIDGYGQLELNNVAFRRDGRVEAQLPLDETDFATVMAENGMLLAVDQVNHCIRMPEADEDCPIALNYTAEKLYDVNHNGLKDFALPRGTFYPRLGYLAVGDKFTTNCVAYNTANFADDAALKSALEPSALASSAVYGGINTDGAILLGTSAASVGPDLRVIAGTTMPDGTYGIKFQVYGA